MKSMTGFAELSLAGQGYHVDMRMRGVNGKHLDAQFRMQDTLLSLEPELLSVLKSRISRGRITVWIDLRIEDPEKAGIRLNTQLLGSLAAQFNRMRDQYPELQFSVPLTAVFNRDANLMQSDPDPEFLDTVRNTVMETFHSLLAQFDEVRQREGLFLKDDFAARVETLTEGVAQVKSLRDGFFEKQLTAARERLARLLAEQAPDEARLIQEAGILADRLDVTEEITRLQAHLEAFRIELDTAGPIGKKLDFMLQEMNREVNTIGSKSRDEQVSRQVVAMKTELEKIREQVQNIE